VAALLTILGFSLYDTIIVFDRIRENVPRMPRATFSQIANRSMSEVIVRSLVTSVSTLFPVLALMLFGGETLTDFGFALLVGIASGAYSSIFIATPVLTHWKEREAIYRRRTEAALQAHGGHIPAYADGSVADPDQEAAAAAARHREPRAARRAAAQRAGRAARPPAGDGGPARGATTSTSSSTASTAGRSEPEPPVPTDAAASSDPGPAPTPAPADGPDGAAAEREADGTPQSQATDDKRGKGNRARRKKHGRR
jgi:SecD/SecF fusion protein